MKVRLFVTGSAFLLAIWLTATFLSEVPVERYPQFGKGSVPLSAKAAKPPEDEEPIAAIEADDFPAMVIE